MFRIIKKVVGSMATNCYIVVYDKKCLVFDPGDQGDYILEEIIRENLKICAIFATHGHSDHIGAVGEIQLYQDCAFFVNFKDNFLIRRVKNTPNYYIKYNPIFLPIKKIEPLSESQHSIEDFHFEVIETPGHTPGSVSYYFKNEKIILTGDTLFSYGVDDASRPYSSKSDLLKSLLKIKALPDDITVLPGHENEDMLSNLKKFF